MAPSTVSTTAPHPDQPLTYTVAEAAALLGISRGLAYEMVRTNVLPALHLGKRVLIPRHGLLAMLETTGAEVAR